MTKYIISMLYKLSKTLLNAGILDIIKLLEKIMEQYPYVKPLEQENIELKHQLEILKLKLLLAQNGITIPKDF